ncbi:MAG TPA: PaaI family thioesterase [Gammaproteobacteria bacterium]|jgi:acyl-CoA thioesterase|nr:PaaI family thioesterase [Gammaproteobacteria bacterium]HIL63107.1 PaaI family thioesterase [Porticoccaceae bacterium]
MNDTEISMSPFGSFLGIEITEFSAGKARCRVELKDHHLNNGGRVHGGLLTSLADTTAGVAVRTVRPEGKLSATTDLSVAFIRPPQGDSLEAVAEVIHAGKRLFRTEISVFSADKLVARTNATFMIVDASKP